MENKNTLILAAFLSLCTSSLTAGVANIAWGSTVAAGGAQFFGADAGAADNIAIGYFTGNAVDADGLAGWNSYATDSTFAVGGWNTTDALAEQDTTAAESLDAYILIADGALQAFVRANDWVALTGTESPTPVVSLSYTFDAADAASGITGIAATGTTLTITDGGGTDFLGGTSGTGVSFTLTAVPEPSTFAALAGLSALGAVMVRRRRA